MPAAFASSSIEATPDYPEFDLLATIQEAQENGFSAVQLYIDAKKFSPEYYKSVLEALKETALTVVIHLPNNYGIDYELEDQDLEFCENLVSELPNRDIRFLIHYGFNSNRYAVPKINGKYALLENVRTGTFDKVGVIEALSIARSIGTGFVFDYGRIMYASTPEERLEVLAFIAKVINEDLDPAVDIIHAGDKLDWTSSPRKGGWAALGDPEAIGSEIVPLLLSYSNRGGVVVFEQENKKAAVDSRRVLEDTRVKTQIDTVGIEG